MVIIVSIQFGCNKLIEVDVPAGSIVGDMVFIDAQVAAEALTGIYAAIREEKLFAVSMEFPIGSSMLSDEVQKREHSQSDRYLKYGEYYWSIWSVYMGAS